MCWCLLELISKFDHLFIFKSRPFKVNHKNSYPASTSVSTSTSFLTSELATGVFSLPSSWCFFLTSGPRLKGCDTDAELGSENLVKMYVKTIIKVPGCSLLIFPGSLND